MRAPPITEVSKRLSREYGNPDFGWPNEDPLDTLVGVILSQRTTDTLSQPALFRLKKRYPKLESVMDAPLGEIKKQIQPAGLSNIKALRIRSVLREIAKRNNGNLSLDFLHDMNDTDAHAYLLSLKGVGPKSAAIVLNFTFHRPFFPVDTHIHRVMGRLGYWDASRVSLPKAHQLADQLIPSKLKDSLHVQLIAHGRAVCTARNPKCGECVLYSICAWPHKQKFAAA